MKTWNNRQKICLWLVVAVLVLGAVTVAGMALADRAVATDLTRKNAAPCASFPFGTDWLGRDMLARTLKGLPWPD